MCGKKRKTGHITETEKRERETKNFLFRSGFGFLRLFIERLTIPRIQCAKCVESMSTRKCKHSDSERALVSTWTSVEIEFASSLGYKVLKIYEFFVYTETSFLFKNFYTKLARIKLESEGFPDNAVTLEQKNDYVAKLNKAMPGLDLKVENIENNPGRRAFAKDLSNMVRK